MDSGPSPFTSTLAQLWEERKRVELPARGTQDQVVWSKEASGEFSMGLLGMLSDAEAIQFNCFSERNMTDQKRPVVHGEL